MTPGLSFGAPLGLAYACFLIALSASLAYLKWADPALVKVARSTAVAGALLLFWGSALRSVAVGNWPTWTPNELALNLALTTTVATLWLTRRPERARWMAALLATAVPLLSLGLFISIQEGATGVAASKDWGLVIVWGLALLTAGWSVPTAIAAIGLLVWTVWSRWLSANMGELIWDELAVLHGEGLSGTLAWLSGTWFSELALSAWRAGRLWEHPAESWLLAVWSLFLAAFFWPPGTTRRGRAVLSILAILLLGAGLAGSYLAEGKYLGSMW